MTVHAFDIQSLHNGYANGVSAEEVIEELYRRIEAVADPGIFIHLEEKGLMLAQARELGTFDPVGKPLWGIPYVIKDNIDAEGLLTTAGCPSYGYEATSDAFCVAQLREAGALLVGKTNMDQFATGLVGVRSPYQPPKNAVNPDLIPGGSSSGSAVSVSHGIVSFALGTDTAGSGRVPAALNNIIGLKPSLGAISSSGVVPACRTLDTVSIFALNADDAYKVFSIANIFDENDVYAKRIRAVDSPSIAPKFTVGIPSVDTREFYGDTDQESSFDQSLQAVSELGGRLVEVDFSVFYQVAHMLYEGAWVAERYMVVEEFLKNNPDALHPVTKAVIEKADGLTAADAFRNFYSLKALKVQAETILSSVDLLCVPTVPTYYTVMDVQNEPFETNARLGTYTNFVNLLDMCGIAVPVESRKDGNPGSVTLLGKSGKDAELAALAGKLHKQSDVKAGSTGWGLPDLVEKTAKPMSDEIELAVVGAHMSGLPLNNELTRLNARFLRTEKTAPCYKLYALAGGPPQRPGLVRDDQGACIELETWAIPHSRFGEFIAGVPQPLAIGTLNLENGDAVKGFLCETHGLVDAVEITSYGGWRNYLELNSG